MTPGSTDHIFREVEAAWHRLQGAVWHTPLLRSHALSQRTQGEVYLKLESEQRTGSFKLRGATNKILWLDEQGDRRPVITASTGNHGLGVASALHATGREGIIVVPEGAVETKLRALRALGVDIMVHGSDCFVSEAYARRLAEERDYVYISPYNDPQIIGGQGTIAVELLDQLETPPDNVLVTVGGGGLISGIGAYLHGRSPSTRLLGCQPARSPEMALSVRRDRYTTVEPQPTLSDASAGAFEPDSITYPLCQTLVDSFFLVEEEQIVSGLRWLLEHERKLVEGAAAVALAPLLEEETRWAGQRTVVVLCGGNISTDKLRKVL